MHRLKSQHPFAELSVKEDLSSDKYIITATWYEGSPDEVRYSGHPRPWDYRMDGIRQSEMYQGLSSPSNPPKKPISGVRAELQEEISKWLQSTIAELSKI